MDKEITHMLESKMYKHVCAKADQYYNNYEYDLAEEIYNALYEKVVDDFGETSLSAIHIMMKIADTNLQKAKYNSAFSIYMSALYILISNGHENANETINILLEIVKIYINYNRYNNAYKICVNAYEIAVHEFPYNVHLIFRILRTLAECCDYLGDYDSALTYYEKAMKIYEHFGCGNLYDYAMICDGLAYTYRHIGLWKKAEKTFKKGIHAISNSKDSNLDETLLLIMNDMCGIYSFYHKKKKQDKEFALRKKILKKAKKLYGYEHYNVHISISNLADAYIRQGNYRKSAKLYTQCYRWAKENLGKQHHETVRNMRCLSDVLCKMGYYRKALELAEESHRYQAETMGEEHIDAIIAEEQIAFLYVKLNKYSIAKQIYKRTMKYFQDKNGKNTDYYYSLMGYTHVCALNGEYDNTLIYSDELEELSKGFENPVNTDIINYFRGLAYKGLGKFSEAEKCQRKYIEDTKKEYGKKHPDVLNSKYELAYILFYKGECEKALEICINLADSYEKNCQVVIDKLKNYTLLARIYCYLCDFEKSDSLLKMLFKSVQEDEYPAALSDVCYAAAENMLNMRNYYEAKKYAEKALELRKEVYENNNIEIDNSVELLNKIEEHIKNL